MAPAGLLWLLLYANSNIPVGETENTNRDSLIELYNRIIEANIPRMPPFNDDKPMINVSLGIGNPSILQLGNTDQILTTSLILTLMWNDSRVQWNPAKFANYTLLEVDNTDVWTPLVMIQNAAHGSTWLQTSVPVVVHSNGLHLLNILDVYKTTCKIDISKYPFDTQVCVIVLTSQYGFPVLLEPHLSQYTDEVNKLRIENGEWNITSIVINRTYINNSVFAVKMTFVLKRKFLFYIINIIFPMALLSVLNSMVFLLPTSSGEKMGFVMTVFMAHAVFLNIIQNSLPTTSDNISNLALYLLLNEIQGFLAIAGTIIIEIRYHSTLNDKDKLDKTKSRALDCINKLKMNRCQIAADSGQNDEESSQVQTPNAWSAVHNKQNAGIFKVQCGQISDRNLDTVFFLITFAMAFANICIFSL